LRYHRRRTLSFSSAARAAILAAGLVALSCGSAAAAQKSSQTCGHASWYALSSKTASGERMNPALLTAAHKSYKFGTLLRVHNRKNGKSVVVRVNDRGPRHRMIDLSRAAASVIGIKDAGVGQVCTEVVASR
jgi:rare lipoprotein A